MPAARADPAVRPLPPDDHNSLLGWWEKEIPMAYERQWIIDTLHRLGYTQAAEAAARELPESISADRLQQFVAKHGVSRDELTSRMGGSP